MSHPRKIYIDTKYKTKDSVSSSDFKIELPETALLPEKCKAYLDEICIPHSFYTIEAGINDKFYLHTSTTAANPPLDYWIITIPSKIYTGADLATELSTQMGNALSGGGYGGTLAASYGPSTQSIEISTTNNTILFRVLTESDIATKLQGSWNTVQSPYDENDPADLNGEILKLTEASSPYYNIAYPFTSNFVNLNSIRNLYITSSNLGNYNSIGANSERTIIKKVPVDVDFNHMIFNNQITGLDYIDVSKQTLKTINFKIQTVDGKTVPLHGAHVSFSIIFDLLE